MINVSVHVDLPKLAKTKYSEKKLVIKLPFKRFLHLDFISSHCWGLGFGFGINWPLELNGALYLGPWSGSFDFTTWDGKWQTETDPSLDQNTTPTT